MLTGSDLRPGIAIRVEGTLYKVVEANYHSGQGKMAGITHAKLRHLETGTIRECRFRADETVEDVMPERQNLQFLYRDDRLAHFMHPETFEQVDIETKGRANRQKLVLEQVRTKRVLWSSRSARPQKPSSARRPKLGRAMKTRGK